MLQPFEYILDPSLPPDRKHVTKDSSSPEETYYGYKSTKSQGREYKGRILYDNGDIFEGHFKNGLPNGKGRKTKADQSFYEGNYVLGKCEGQGKLVMPDGAVYDGAWADNQFNGKGMFAEPDGSKYEGDYVKGLKHGYGKEELEDGSYEGFFANDIRDGNGI